MVIADLRHAAASTAHPPMNVMSGVAAVEQEHRLGEARRGDRGAKGKRGAWGEVGGSAPGTGEGEGWGGRGGEWKTGEQGPTPLPPYDGGQAPRALVWGIGPTRRGSCGRSRTGRTEQLRVPE